jgi:O-antigen biosynthesis protein WbqP
MLKHTTIRIFDLILAIFAMLVLSPVLILLYVFGLFDTGVPLLRQVRVGIHRSHFVLLKFRTMRLDTAHVASHLVSSTAITPLGFVLRRTKLDELPQLWNVIRGDMSIVGPRPGLPNQHELTRARESYGVYTVRPGMTGLAQVNRIDMSIPDLLAATDAQMIKEMSLANYFKFILMTLLGRGCGDRVINK